MNRYAFSFSLGLTVAFATCAIGAANLSVSPAVLTNDALTQIDFSITGIAPGSTVSIQKFMDVNRNGIVDAGDLLVQAFSVSDGQVPRIGGVRNINLPGDEDGVTNGQIHAWVNYPASSLTLEHIAAPYLFRLVDPLGGFTAVTVPFSVVQKTTAQGVTGQVYGGNGQPLGNAVIVYFPQNSPGGAGVLSDSSGNFTVYAPPGEFFVMPVKPGSVTDQGIAAVTIQSNVFATRTITNITATRTLSGRVSDAASDVGLPGLFIQAETEEGLFALGFTDANGAYSIPVSDDIWKVRANGDSGIGFLGYVDLGNKLFADTAAGSVANLDFALPKGTAMIYGTVRDNSSNAVTALTLSAQDESFSYQQTALTDASGRYSLPVFAGDWFVQVENSEATARGLFGDPVFVSISNSTAVLQNITMQRVTAHIRGRVVSPTGTPIGNAGVTASRDTGSGNSVGGLYVQTSADGSFDLGVYAGAWNVALECSSATDNGIVGPSLQFSITDGIDRNGVVLVARPASYLLTINIQDQNGDPVSASAYAFTTSNGSNYSACASVNNDGQQVIAVFAGSWQIGISGDVSSRGYENPPSQTVSVPAGDLNRTFVLYPRGQSPASLASATFQGGHFQFSVNGAVEGQYRIEYTTNLASPINWIPLQTNTAFGGTFHVDDFGSSQGSPRFYRSRLLP